jgi:hypothetical protein
MVIVLLFAMASCQKDQNIINSNPIETGESIPVESGEPELKITSASILNATSASQIPRQFFDSYLEYKAWYQHQKQPNSTSCSWTSYVNCIGTIVRGASANMTQYTTSISTVKYRCANYYPQVNTYGSNSIMALNWHTGAYDGSKINYKLQSTSDRFAAVKYMLAHINTNHTPFVVISKMNNISHYRVVFSIDWKQSETTSMVYYTDCAYASQGNYFANQQSMTLQSFLNLMLNPPVVNYYNMLFMWKK